MPDFINVKCNICGMDDTEPVSNKGQFDLPVHVVICKNCGLSYLNPRWPKQEYLRFYEHEYDNYYRPILKKEDKTSIAETNPIVQRIRHLNLYRDTVKHALDIGSGEGNNIKALRQVYQRARFYAIEPSSSARKMLDDDGVKILHSDVDGEWNLPHSGKFDIIVMRHVLEHLMDPVSTMQKVFSCLSDDGLLYVAVPNCLNPTSYLESKWFRVVHTYYFNKYSLQNVLLKANLNPIHLIDGDEYNKGEVFAFAKKSARPMEIIISADNYKEQKELFSRRLKKENSGIGRFKQRMRNILQ